MFHYIHWTQLSRWADQAMTSVFDQIIAGVEKEIAEREAIMSFTEVKQLSRKCPPPRDALAVLRQPGCQLIAEVKRMIPESGIIAEKEKPHIMAQQFEQGGAAAIAYQPELRRLRGSLAEMVTIRESVSVPILCRDFIVDPYQIHEARYYGADIIPLRVAALGQARLVALLDRVQSLGMVALVEVRTPAEASWAMRAGARVIGVNARDFETMTLNRRAFAEISSGIPQDIIKIALSGVRSAAELYDYASHGADAVVMGRSLIQAESPTDFTKTLVSAAQHPACPRR